MIGASKLNEELVAEIKTLFATTTLKDTEIAEMYNVSRPLITNIRRGIRWNKVQRSFVMKSEIKKLTRTITEINGVKFSTGVSPIITINGEMYVLVHYLNNREHIVQGKIFEIKPSYDTIREAHDVFIKSFNSLLK